MTPLEYLGLTRKPTVSVKVSVKEEVRSDPPLLAALRKLDIEPLNKEAVEKYKTYKLDKEWKNLLAGLSKDGWYKDGWYKDEWYKDEDGYPDYEDAVRMCMDRHGFTSNDKYAYLRKPQRYPHCYAMGWHRHQMSVTGLAAEVGAPEYVTRKAAAIKDEVPGVVLETDSLESREQQYDPFLVVKLGDEEYYVEVWGHDEREFVR